jgi:hypothetical protein
MARQAVDMAPCLLAVDTVVWQRSLVVMYLQGVAMTPAEAVCHADMLCEDCLAPGWIANRLALQRCFGLPPAGVYEQFSGYVAHTSARRLVGRLLYLEQHGLLPLLVAAEGARTEPSALPASTGTPGESLHISLCDLSSLRDQAFSRLLRLPNGAADLADFNKGLQDSPAWRLLWFKAKAESALMKDLLPPEIRPRGFWD